MDHPVYAYVSSRKWSSQQSCFINYYACPLSRISPRTRRHGSMTCAKPPIRSSQRKIRPRCVRPGKQCACEMRDAEFPNSHSRIFRDSVVVLGQRRPCGWGCCPPGAWNATPQEMAARTGPAPPLPGRGGPLLSRPPPRVAVRSDVSRFDEGWVPDDALMGRGRRMVKSGGVCWYVPYGMMSEKCWMFFRCVFSLLCGRNTPFPTIFGQSACTSVKVQPISTLRLPNHARLSAELPNRRNYLRCFYFSPKLTGKRCRYCSDCGTGSIFTSGRENCSHNPCNSTYTVLDIRNLIVNICHRCQFVYFWGGPRPPPPMLRSAP